LPAVDESAQQLTANGIAWLNLAEVAAASGPTNRGSSSEHLAGRSMIGA